MSLTCAIIGLPNVGKSTLFNILTKADIRVANFPFCTIAPNTGIVPVPDIRIDQLAEIVNPQRTVPATIKFIDIAGLVKGASKGEGLGNQFLDNIRESEVICHVVRCFEDNNIIHIAGKICPLEDINIVNTELALSDMIVCDRAIHQIQKRNKSDSKDTNLKLSVLTKCLFHLSNGSVLRTLNLSFKEKSIIHDLRFLTLKPIMYIANVNENEFENNLYLKELYAIAETTGSIVVTICALLESDIAELDEKERKEFIMKLGLKESGLNRIICAAYELLKLQTYFTAGIKEVRAWAVPIGTTALQAARKIHTDFEKGFIRAQVISFTNFITYKGGQAAKAAGKMHSEGKEYILKDGDVIRFLFNV